uniref:CEP63/Deup1 CEP152 binding coiled coil domain-containing protein n=1 Tax=Malurus cyaneus samueli TaxID=2593467 RepID=A0A8C5TJX0_9PASS
MEADVSEMRNELQSRDSLWRRMQLECQQLHTELLKIKEYKDICKNKQKSLIQLEELVSWKQQNHVYREEQSHRSEQERTKTEISDLTKELHQKEITIATIMEKASLLERQLKMELETKHKLLAKQQVCNIDLCNKEHGNFTASVHKMKRENLRLQNSLVKQRNYTETSMLGCMDTYREAEHSYQTHSKMQGKEESCYRSRCFPHLEFDIANMLEHLLVLPNHGFLFIVQSPPEMSFLTTTEKFLQEEEEHAREFEERLNSHLEELQRYSENTLKKYARMQQSRHT